jgi:putative SOS response-associated peptidase YedK
MCGRFTMTMVEEELKKRFRIQFVEAQVTARYNVAPSQNIPVIVSDEEGNRKLTEMRWGLVPFWAKDTKIGNRMINARSETITEKNTFKRALTRRRCLIPADGFYEWKKVGKVKQPMRITLKDQKIFSMAGLWDTWKNPEGKTINSCTIITCGANSFMKDIHDRMPVILSKKAEEEWLNQKQTDPDKLKKHLAPHPSKNFQSEIVSTLVDSPGYDGPECVMPLPEQKSKKTVQAKSTRVKKRKRG